MTGKERDNCLSLNLHPCLRETGTYSSPYRSKFALRESLDIELPIPFAQWFPGREVRELAEEFRIWQAISLSVNRARGS